MANFSDNLVGHWLMNDDLATTAVLDNKGSNDGVLNVNTDTISVEGKINKALDFDGTNDYVDCGHDASLDITSAISVGMWVYHNAVDVLQMYASKNEVFYFRVDATNKLTFRFYESGVGWATAHTTALAQIEVSTWYYVTATYNGTDVKIYVNGVEVYTSDTDSGKTINTNINDLYISSGFGASVNEVNGKMDDVRIYDTAITAYYVKLLYNNGAGTEDENVQSNTLLLGCNF